MPQAFQFVANDGEVIRDPDGLGGQVINDGGFCVRSIIFLTFSYNLTEVDAVLRELVFDVELADTIYLIAEEIQAERRVVAVTIDIHDGTAHGKLPGLEDKIHAFKA